MSPRETLLDLLGRPLRNLRISVTDRCNLRCSSCMPELEYVWLPRADILRFEELAVLVDVFTRLGVRKVRLTGGEPLLRRGVEDLVRQIVQRPGLEDVALTTNGILLAEHARALREAGLHRLTVSLDTLRPERFARLTRHDGLERVLEGLRVARDAGFRGTKVNAVVLRGLNDDELVALLEFGRSADVEVRFIEYMDVGGATQWTPEAVVTKDEILARLSLELGPIEAEPAADSAPADRFRLRDGTRFGIISSTSAPFCRACDRSRLTADGLWLNCLYATGGLDLRGPLRSGAGAADLAELVRRAWGARTDRGAEERAALGPGRRGQKGPLDPHLEMHTRGG